MPPSQPYPPQPKFVNRKLEKVGWSVPRAPVVLSLNKSKFNGV